MIEHPLFDRELLGNIVYLHKAIFEIPRKRFIIKILLAETTDVSIEIYQLLPQFSTMSAWSNMFYFN